MSYDMIDRFLRNNLGDDDYAEYSAALDSLCAPPQRQPLTDEEITALLVELCVPKGYEGVTGTSTAVVRAIEAAHGIKGEA